MTASVSTHQLRKAGQSPWLDYISRDLITSGGLKSLIQDSGVLGVTSNPSIFEQAINKPGSGYEKEIKRLVRAGSSTFEIYDRLSIEDIQSACDLFKPVFSGSGGEHGFVSLEVIPGLAYHEEDTVREAVRLFKAVNRPNVMIKVPATKEGIPAVQRLIAQGINVNITLMFSLRHYHDVALAYIEGLEAFAKAGGDLSKVHSVASVFVSRIDTLIDKQLELMAQDTADPARKQELQSLLGKAAIANSKMIYQRFKELFYGERFRKLQAKGAWIQKVLWGSTSVKNPKYSDLMYVEELIGVETVNTMPKATLEAFLDHGEAREASIEKDPAAAESSIRRLNTLGFNLDIIGEELQKQGAKLFCQSFDSLMHSIEKLKLPVKTKPAALYGFKLDSQTAQDEEILNAISTAETQKYHSRFFQKDATLWKNDLDHQKVIANRLGWIQAADWILGKLYELDLLTAEIQKEKIRDLVLLGMGGSSLAPEVMNAILRDKKTKGPKLHILDTTDPDTILNVEKKLNYKKTLFIVASKSGGTVETLSQMRYFYDRTLKVLAKGKKDDAALKTAGRQFIAITDSGSDLESTARKNYFKRLFINPSDIGGRYSALSFFGIVPVALAGIPVRPLLQETLNFLRATSSEATIEKNPAFYLGLVLGTLAKTGKVCLPLFFDSHLEPFGAWMEQLIAESTGKEGKGILPIVGADPLDPAIYGNNSVLMFIYMKARKTSVPGAWLKKIKAAKLPVIEMTWEKPASIGAQFLFWEIVTSISSAALHINPFDEPNVKESKAITTSLLDKLKTSGTITNPKNRIEVSHTKGFKRSNFLWQELEKNFKKDRYVALLPYLSRDKANTKVFQKLQMKIWKKFNLPVLVGFGPRYLHSIGQLYKGGQKKGNFIIFLGGPTKDASVPGTHFKFSQLIKAQAVGDLEAIRAKALPALMIDLGKNAVKSLAAFEKGLVT